MDTSSRGELRGLVIGALAVLLSLSACGGASDEAVFLTAQPTHECLENRPENVDDSFSDYPYPPQRVMINVAEPAPRKEGGTRLIVSFTTPETGNNLSVVFLASEAAARRLFSYYASQVRHEDNWVRLVQRKENAVLWWGVRAPHSVLNIVAACLR